MSQVKIYGMPQSRAFRALWAAKELGLEYQNVPHGFAEVKTDEYKSINPNQKMPALQDGDVTLCESMAINLYLARKYDKGLWPKDVADEGRTYQWSFWAITEVEKPILTVLLDVVGMVKKTPEEIAAAKKELEKPLKVLDQALAGRDYLLGKDFSIADLNVAAVLSWAKGAKIDLGPYPHISAWLDRCLARPAFAAARKG